MPDTEDAMAKRIGDLARAAGIGVETVRFYERIGLVPQPPKPERGWREYGANSLAGINQIRLARKMGLTLADMQRLKALASEPQTSFCVEVRQTVAGRLMAIENDIAARNAKRVMLKRWLDQCRRRAGSDCPLYAQINAINPRNPRRSPGKE
jgi:MerR family copper efflux transcriptional regulator